MLSVKCLCTSSLLSVFFFYYFTRSWGHAEVEKLNYQCKFLRSSFSQQPSYDIMVGFLGISCLLNHILFSFWSMKRGNHHISQTQKLSPFLISIFSKSSLLKILISSSSHIYKHGPHSCSSFIVHSSCTNNKNFNGELSWSQPTKRKVSSCLPLKAFVSHLQ